MRSLKSFPHRPAILATALAAAAIVPAAASAAQRYASPGGSGSTCSIVLPCSLTTATDGASFGDEVIVNPGNYSLTTSLVDPAYITIHGVFGQPRPHLLFSGPNQFGVSLQHGTLLQYVEVDQSTYFNAVTLNTGALDQVIARGIADSAVTVFAWNSWIRDSLVVASGSAGARAILIGANGDTNKSTLRNDTVVANLLGGVAIEAQALGVTGAATVDAWNVLAVGGPGGGTPLLAWTDSSGANATINPTYSNFASYVETGTNAHVGGGFGSNQSAAPKFVDPIGGDYHEAPGSPTIDAGVDDIPNGGYDFEHDGRIFGGGTDIGADESPYLAPPPPPGGGGGGGGGGSSLDPAPTSDPAPATGQPAPAAAVAPSTTAPVGSKFAGVRLVSKKLRLVGRYVTIRLSCPAGTTGSCTGRTKLAARSRSKTAGSPVLGRARFSIAAGHVAKVKVHVSRSKRHRLAHVRRLSALVTNATRSGAGESAASVAAVTIRRA